jgi:N-acyl homoserine lactone hydrolase
LINPTEASMHEVEAVLLGELDAVPEAVARFGVGHCGSSVRLPIYSYLVRTATGGLVLFDVGCSPPRMAADQGHPSVVEESHRTAAGALWSRGVDPAAVDAVVLSHLHWDHSYGLSDFPNAEVLVQRRELQYAFAPHPEQWASYESFELGLVPDWFGQLERVRPLDGATALGPGLLVVPLPGHTPGSQGLVVETADRTYCCCGDHIVTYDNLAVSPRPDRRGSAVPPGVHTDLVAWRESLSRTVEAGWTLLPAHERRVESVLRDEPVPGSSPGAN